MLSRAGQAYVLAVQRRLAKRGDTERVGDIVRSLELADSEAIEEVAGGQEKEGQHGQTQQPFLRRVREPLKAPLTFWLVAVVAFLGVHFLCDVAAGTAASVCGFFAAAGSTLARFSIQRQWWPSLRHAIRAGVPIVAVCLVIWVVVHVAVALASVENAHTLNREQLTQLLARLQVAGEEIEVANTGGLRGWVSGLLVAVGLLAGLFMMAVAYIAWKGRVQRFLESRSSLLENLMFRTRECMADSSKDLDERKRIALDLILDTVRNWTRMNGWDWLREKTPFFWPAPLETTAYFLEPVSPAPSPTGRKRSEAEEIRVSGTTEGPGDGQAPPEGIVSQPAESELADQAADEFDEVGPALNALASDPRAPREAPASGDGEGFAAVARAYNRRGPASVTAMHGILAERHRPRRWREEVFRERVRVAKGDDPRGWRDRYLKMARHPEMGSITGWVFDRQEVVVTDDASECLAFDDSFWSQLKAAGYGDDDLKWVSVRSFVACPVPGDGDEPRGVLLVAKNFTHGFGPEDEEFAVAASQMIATVLSAG